MPPLQRACTFLFVPGNRPERFRQTRARGHDCGLGHIDLQADRGMVCRPDEVQWLPVR